MYHAGGSREGEIYDGRRQVRADWYDQISLRLTDRRYGSIAGNIGSKENQFNWSVTF